MAGLTSNLRLGRLRQEDQKSRPGLATRDPVTKQRHKRRPFFPFSLTCWDSWSVLLTQEDGDPECVQIFFLIFRENGALQTHRGTLVEGKGDGQFGLASAGILN